MRNKRLISLAVVVFALSIGLSKADNPLVTGQFTADPTARVYNGKIYVFPSHDIPAPPNTVARKDWFVMEDYHVFSSKNLMDWEDHGVIIHQDDLDWIAKDYTMWAPDAIEKNGKYYFYFPANRVAENGRRGGSAIGVGVADKPEGPYIFEEKPIDRIGGIDPGILIDPKDGKGYIYLQQGGLTVAPLKDNMIEVESAPVRIQGLPRGGGLIEGPFPLERNGKYYLTFPHVIEKTEALEYVVADNPMGPFEYGGIIMDESPTGCWTNHHSIVEYEGQWYLFYHHNDYSPNFDKNRSIRADSLFFEPDGSIRKVIPTLRGIGVADSKRNLQIDRYSLISKTGASIAYLDTTNYFDGWKAIFEADGAWFQYNTVQFDKKPKTVEARIQSSEGAVLEVRLDKLDGPVLATIEVPKSSQWQVVSAKVKKGQKGRHNLIVSQKGKGTAEVDWVTFK